MLKIGLTGSIAVGKSYVLSIFKELGCAVFDADQIARAVVEPGKPAYQDIIAEFGSDILAADGGIDRVRLGQIVFGDEARRKRLNEIVHPRVGEEQQRLLADAGDIQPGVIAVVDAALMIESGGYKRFDKLVVAYCDPELQIERLMRRNNLSRADAEQRIAAQMSSDEKRRYADFEIDTSGSYEDTRKRTLAVYDDIVADTLNGSKQVS